MGELPVSWDDLVVFIFGECVGLPLSYSGWDHFVNGDLNKAVLGVGIGLPVELAAATYHWWKRWLRESGRSWTQHNAERWWPVGILFLLIYVCGPTVVRRITPCVNTTSSAPSPIAMRLSRDQVMEADFETYLGSWNIWYELNRVAQTPCRVKITVPEDRGLLRNEIKSFLEHTMVKCEIVDDERDSRPDLYANPYASPTPTAPPNGVTIHRLENSQNGIHLQQALNSTGLKVRPLFAFPPNVPTDVIWIEIGKGSPWQ